VLAHRPKEIIHATTLTAAGLETRFIDGAVRVLELHRVKALLGRAEGEIRSVALGADRSFLIIEFMDSTREFLPADIIRPDWVEDSAIVAATVGHSAALTGERIRRARLRAALTQAQLAERIGMSRHAILRFESGRTLPKISDLERIARAVGMELGELLKVEGR
jgi:DNA-binding XRE family transcriptional regulator